MNIAPGLAAARLPIRIAVVGALLVSICAVIGCSASGTDANAESTSGEGSEAAAVAPGGERPNFVHILTDDQTIDSMRFMPIVDRKLGRKGTSFSDYNDVQPLCCPSRASFLTGQYPHNHGVLDNAPPYGYGALDWDHTLYTALHDDGYRTGWIGKVLNPKSPSQGLQPEPGFDDWFVPLEDAEREGTDMFEYRLSDNGTEVAYSDQFQNALYARRARSFLRADSDQPFILTLSVHSPHWAPCKPGTGERECPPQPAPADRDRFADERYPFGPDYTADRAHRRYTNRYWRREFESLQSVDRVVGSLVADLRRRGELDDTYIIFQSDNGLMHGEHGSFTKNVPWDRSVRVPLIIRGPGFAAGATRDDLTANVDVPATILDAAGVAPPVPPDGHSLLSSHRRRYLLLERLVGPNRGPATKNTRPWRQIKTSSGWAYWSDLEGGHQHLYDLTTDPHEVRSLVRSDPARARSLAAKVASVADCADPCP